MNTLIRLMLLPALVWPVAGVLAQTESNPDELARQLNTMEDVTGAIVQTMSIPVGQQAPALQGITVPNRGMTEEGVESSFGTPIMRNGPVGQPPISYWEYDNYFVYFDSGRVLHSVLKHNRN